MDTLPEKTSVTCLWQTPVYVRIGYGSSESLHGPNEALVYLANRWPAKRGPYYENAKFACVIAVEQNGSSEIAREAFIAAAIEANILA